MDAVGVRVHEQDHTIVPQGLERECIAQPRAKRLCEGREPRIGHDLLRGCADRVERLALHRQHRLELRVAHPAHGTRGRIAFDDIQLHAGAEAVVSTVVELERSHRVG